MADLKLTEKEYEHILELKRDLHMHPETAHNEYRTSAKITEILKSLPSVELIGDQPETGVLARIRGKEDGSEVLLRADLDALPQTEEYESPWKSVNEGVMHACGHDFHASSLAGAAMILNRLKQSGELRNTVDLVFQPAEEGTTGAKMLEDMGLFEIMHPDVCFGMHNWPAAEGGKVLCHRDCVMAGKRSFEIRIIGSGGHGSMPHLNIDPIVCAAAVVQSLQTIVSRSTNPQDSLVVSVSMIEGGRPVNIVADDVRMVGTIRSLSDKALDGAIERLESIVSGTAASYGCGYEINWEEKIRPVVNSPDLYDFALRRVSETGAEAEEAKPSLASEDFSMYLSHAPGFFYWVGSRMPGEEPEDLHRPRFHTYDEAMKIASELLARSAQEFKK